MFEIFQYGFMQRGLAAGVLIALIAPLIGIFLVLRRYSLIADTLSHVSLAGVAIGLIAGVNPMLAALVTSVGASLAIDRLRVTKRVYGETALSLFLSGSLAVAIVLIGVARGFTTSLFSYLFGSIVTVQSSELAIIVALSLIIIIGFLLYERAFLYLAFDEDAAQVSGLPVRAMHTIFMVLSAITVAVAIPIVGVLLISALLVIPVATALQLKKSFSATILIAELFSIAAVVIGMIGSFYLDVPPGGAIVLLMLLIFGCTMIFQKITTRLPA